VSRNEAPRTFEVVVGRIATRDLAYVWRIEEGEPTGLRLLLKRSIVRDHQGRFVEITEGMHLLVAVDPAQPNRIEVARVRP
jgi:hypothetical protein